MTNAITEHEESAFEPAVWVWVVCLVYIPSAMATMGWIAWVDGVSGLQDRLMSAHPGRDMALGGAVGSLIVACSVLVTRFLAAGRRMEEAFRSMLGVLPLWVCLVVALFSSVGEEIFFRGLLQPEIGLWWASFLFAVVHVPPRRDLIGWPVFAFCAGLLFGVLYDFTGAVGASMVAHFLVNAVNLRVMSLRTLSLPPTE